MNSVEEIFSDDGFSFDIHFYSQSGKHDLINYINSHANIVAIGFAEWLGENEWRKSFTTNEWYNRSMVNQDHIPIDKVFQLYQQSINNSTENK